MTTENQAPEGAELPPLPEPGVYAIGDYFHDHIKWSKAFTPAQMHAYARAALASQPQPDGDGNEAMAECMRMFRRDMIEAGVIGKSVPPMMMTEAILGAMAAKPSPAEGDALDLVLDEDAADLLRQTIGDGEDASSVRLTVGDGHTGYGLYVSDADYPEEGAVLLRSMSRPANVQPKGMPAEWLDAFEEWRQTLVAADLDGKRDLVWRHIARTGFQAGAAWARSQAPAPAQEPVAVVESIGPEPPDERGHQGNPRPDDRAARADRRLPVRVPRLARAH